ncbi:MAG: carboxy-S-adenosyl-L-methionine synthase CmoA [Desulfobulbus sp.]|jgi:tRNA (cmo5U34)-methyltransferase
MAEDTLYTTGAVNEDFTFNAKVAEVFDDMLDRSIPFYRTVIDATAHILAARLPHEATICDLGCSTGTTLLTLSGQLTGRDFRYIGLDNAPAMLAKAREKSRLAGKEQILHFAEADIVTDALPAATAFLCNYTLQFLRPMLRPAFIGKIYAALPPGGLLLLSEKTISPAHRLNRTFIDLYHVFKKEQGYSDLEIAAKREALENVLIPFSLDENLSLLRSAGFAEVEIYFKWFNFAALVALKH